MAPQPSATEPTVSQPIAPSQRSARSRRPQASAATPSPQPSASGSGMSEPAAERSASGRMASGTLADSRGPSASPPDGSEAIAGAASSEAGTAASGPSSPAPQAVPGTSDTTPAAVTEAVVVCVFFDRKAAETALEELLDSGYDDADVTLTASGGHVLDQDQGSFRRGALELTVHPRPGAKDPEEIMNRHGGRSREERTVM